MFLFIYLYRDICTENARLKSYLKQLANEWDKRTITEKK